MKYQLKKIKDCKHALKVEVDSKSLEERFQAVFRQIQKKATLKGFREGKAPLNLIEKTYLNEANEEVVKSLVSESYYAGVREAKAVPVSQPEIKDLKVERGKVLSYTAEFESSPNFNLRNYKGLKVTRPALAVADADVDKALESLRESRAELVPLEIIRPVAEGDAVRCDIDIFKDGQYSQGQRDALVAVEKTALGPDFLDQVIGAMANEWKELYTGLSPEEKAQGLVGRRPYCKILVKEIKAKRLPELNDEFAVSFGKKDLGDLRAGVRADLEGYKESQLKDGMRAQVYEQLLKSHDMELPESLVERQKKRLIEELSRARQANGAVPSESTNGARTPEQEKELSERARSHVKLFFILERIAEEEKIEPPQEEIDKRIQDIAQKTRHPADEIRKMFEDEIYQTLKHSRTVEYLLSKAALKEENA